MRFAVELYFDVDADSQIRLLWSDLAAAGLPAWPLQIGARPHVSVLVVDSENIRDVAATFDALPLTAPFQLTFGSAGHFNGDAGIVFLKPEPSPDLRRIHDRAVEIARTNELLPLHSGDEWIPHCTCDYELTATQAARAMSVMQKAMPFDVRVQEIGCVEVSPRHVRPIRLRTL